ncbi:uncharacterized protein LOC123908857 isoform X1 [Trifolium pratense]|uniref:uncharacterized protein LOC123908857 isoform X1 n=2 Tax=Trifolium pratense TaxID=57577 RepID=UPI001E6960B0|nr:uncharacterized protein LOC123908857 isoform X1 [Trifolium pratense]
MKEDFKVIDRMTYGFRGSPSHVFPRFLSHQASSLRIPSSSSSSFISGNTTSHLILIVMSFPLLASFIFHFSIAAEHVSFVKDWLISGLNLVYIVFGSRVAAPTPKSSININKPHRFESLLPRGVLKVTMPSQ